MIGIANIMHSQNIYSGTQSTTGCFTPVKLLDENKMSVAAKSQGMVDSIFQKSADKNTVSLLMSQDLRPAKEYSVISGCPSLKFDFPTAALQSSAVNPSGNVKTDAISNFIIGSDPALRNSMYRGIVQNMQAGYIFQAMFAAQMPGLTKTETLVTGKI